MASKSTLRKKTVAILAPTGMLGSMVYNVLKDTYLLILVYKDKDKLEKLFKTYGKSNDITVIAFDLRDLYDDYVQGFPTAKISPNTKKLVDTIGKVDVVINCAGITKPHSLKNPLITYFINGSIPHILSNIYKERLIQITTDCVYDGTTGAPYKEDSLKLPNDLYGLSKSMGEPSELSLVLRTSIIGPEIDNFVLLIEWFKKQHGKTIPGFTNHIWNGITTKQFAIICDRIIQRRNDLPTHGLFHIFSTSLTKYETLKKLREKYKVNVRIKPTESQIPVDRRLATKFNICKTLHIPSFDEMLREL